MFHFDAPFKFMKQVPSLLKTKSKLGKDMILKIKILLLSKNTDGHVLR